MSVLKRHGPKGWVPATNGNIMHAGTMYHDELQNRDKPDQHPMEAITGLKAALENTQPKGDYATNTDLAEKQNKTKIVNVRFSFGEEYGVSDTSSDIIEEWITSGKDVNILVFYGDRPYMKLKDYTSDPSGLYFYNITVTENEVIKARLAIQGTNAIIGTERYTVNAFSVRSNIPPELPSSTGPNVQAVLNALSSDKLSKTGHTPNKNLVTDSSGNISEADFEKPNIGAGDWVTPEMFGAKGDGVTDDTAAFQAAVSSGKYVVVIPSGNYYIEKQIEITKNIKIVGINANIVMKPQTTASSLFNAVNYGNLQSVEISGITLTSERIETAVPPSGHTRENLTSSNVYLVLATDTNVDVHDCRLSGMEVGIFTRGKFQKFKHNLTIRNVSMDNVSMGVFADWMDNITIESTDIKSATNMGSGDHLLYLARGNNQITINNCNLDGSNSRERWMLAVSRGGDDDTADNYTKELFIDNTRIVSSTDGGCLVFESDGEAIIRNSYIKASYVSEIKGSVTHNARITYDDCTLITTGGYILVVSAYDHTVDSPNEYILRNCVLKNPVTAAGIVTTKDHGLYCEFDNCDIETQGTFAMTNNGTALLKVRAYNSRIRAKRFGQPGNALLVRYFQDLIDVQFFGCDIDTDIAFYVSDALNIAALNARLVQCQMASKIYVTGKTVYPKVIQSYDYNGTILQSS